MRDCLWVVSGTEETISFFEGIAGGIRELRGYEQARRRQQPKESHHGHRLLIT
jgi:hypothetical protein